MINIKDLTIDKKMHINGISKDGTLKDIDPKGVCFLQATAEDKEGNEYIVAWRISNYDSKTESTTFDWENPDFITKI